MEHRRIIKQGTVVIATHEDGSIDPAGTFSQRLFVGVTRFLSRVRLQLDGARPDSMGSGQETLYQSLYGTTWLISSRCPSGSRKKQRISLPQSTGGVRNCAPRDRRTW